MALSESRIIELYNKWKREPNTGWRDFARATEAEVRKELQPEIDALKSDLREYMMAANAEANRVDELAEVRKQDEALIRQLVEALEHAAAWAKG